MEKFNSSKKNRRINTSKKIKNSKFFSTSSYKNYKLKKNSKKLKSSLTKPRKKTKSLFLLIFFLIPFFIFFLRTNMVFIENTIYFNENNLKIFRLMEQKETIKLNNITLTLTNESFRLFNKMISTNRTYCGLYDIDNELFLNKKAKIICEKDNKVNCTYQDHSFDYMHTKYCVSENLLLFGSANPTVNGIYKNDNNLFLLDFKTKCFNISTLRFCKVSHTQLEFFKMYVNTIANFEVHPFNSLKETFKKVPIWYYDIQDLNKKTSIKEKITFEKEVSIKTCFTPFQECNKLILTKIAKEKNPKIMAFSFTDKEIFFNLKNTEIIVEKSNTNKYTIDKIKFEKNLVNLTVLFDTNKNKMHHKIFIFNKSIITGSYNPTAHAKVNHESMISIESEKISKIFLNYFNLYKKRNTKRG